MSKEVQAKRNWRMVMMKAAQTVDKGDDSSSSMSSSSCRDDPKDKMLNIDIPKSPDRLQTPVGTSKFYQIINVKRSKEIFVIHPGSMFYSVWETVITILVVATCVRRPYQIAVTPEVVDEASTTIINVLIEVMFLLDIFVNFNTAFYTEDFKFVENRKKIAQNYLKNQFIFDVAAIVPLDLFFLAISLDTKNNWFIFSYLFKLVRITHLFEVYNSITDHTQTNFFRKMFGMTSSTIRLFFFTMLFFLLTHFGACAWITIAVIHQEYNASHDD